MLRCFRQKLVSFFLGGGGLTTQRQEGKLVASRKRRRFRRASGVLQEALLFRASVTIDRRSGQVIQKWGIVIALRTQVTPLDKFSRVVVQEHRSQQTGLRSSQYLELQGDAQSVVLKNAIGFPKDWVRKWQEQVEKFLGFEHSPVMTVEQTEGG